MKKTFLRSSLMLLAGVGFSANAAISAPMYWNLTHTANEGNSLASLTIDNLSNPWEASFGIFYDLDDDGAISSSEYLTLFKASEENTTSKNISWSNDGSGWDVTYGVYNGVSWDLTTFDFDTTTFGVFFEQNDNNQQRIISTDLALFSNNVYPFTLDAYLDPTVISANKTNWVFDLVNSPYYTGDEAIRMSVKMDDISAVPEPATMLLFGAGLVGLAGIRRRKN